MWPMMRSGAAFAVGFAIALVLLCFSAAPLGGGALAQTATAPAPQSQAPAQAPKSFLPPKAGTTKSEAGQAAAAQPQSGFRAWVVAQQRKFNAALAGALRDIKGGNYLTATLTLMLMSFGYGIAHAAGPGHGKAIVSSYLLADRQTARRGVILAFMSAFVQALSAITIFAVIVLVVRGAVGDVRATEVLLERASWAIVALFGAWLLFRQLRSLVTGRPLHDHGHDHDHDHGHAHSRAHGHSHASHEHGHHHHHGHEHHHHDHAYGHDRAAHRGGHTHDHGENCSACGHTHMPGPAQIADSWSLRRALGLAFTIGIRPCTGAIGVLFFAKAIGLMWAGVLSAFSMAVGTAITVSLLAILTVSSRDWAARLAGVGDNRWSGYVQAAAGIGGSILVLGLGIMLFLYPLSEAAPF
jgi:ABC-type nickel/cobalt efflux system permease component RcnA